MGILLHSNYHQVAQRKNNMTTRGSDVSTTINKSKKLTVEQSRVLEDMAAKLDWSYKPKEGDERNLSQDPSCPIQSRSCLPRHTTVSKNSPQKPSNCWRKSLKTLRSTRSSRAPTPNRSRSFKISSTSVISRNCPMQRLRSHSNPSMKRWSRSFGWTVFQLVLNSLTVKCLLRLLGLVGTICPTSSKENTHSFWRLAMFSLLQVAAHAEKFNEAVETAKGHLKSKVNWKILPHVRASSVGCCWEWISYEFWKLVSWRCPWLRTTSIVLGPFDKKLISHLR